MLLDDDGRQLAGLFGTSEQEIEDFNDTQDLRELWEASVDEHEDVYTGEALVDNELLQKELNRSML